MKKKLMMVMCLFMALACVACTDPLEDTAPLIEEKATSGHDEDRKVRAKNMGGEAEGTDRKVRHKGTLGG